MTAPRMPKGLRVAEQTAWRQVLAEFGGADAFEPSDGPLLRSLAVLTARLEDIRTILAGAGVKLIVPTARGVTGHPMLGHERETIKEIRLLHERLAKAMAARGTAQKPKTLAEMKRDLRVAR